MALFESYERRIDNINSVLAEYGINGLEDAQAICDAAGVDAIGIVRGLIMLGLGQQRRTWALVLINALFVGGAVFAGTVGGDGWACLVSLAPQVIGTFSMWYGSDNAIRWVQLGAISPFWLVNNIWISFSIGGIICEVFCMVSTVIYLLRQRIARRRTQNREKT